MGTLLGEMRPIHGRSARLSALVAWSLPLLLVACGGEGDPLADPPSTTTTETTAEPGPRPCAEDRHLVIVDIIGLLTVENIEITGDWLNDGIQPTPRPGTVEVMRAYRERGYELLYITTIPADAFALGAVADIATRWLQSNGYPVDAGARVWVGDSSQREDGQTWIAITDELLRLAAAGVSVDAAYTENADKAYGYATGGVPSERNFSLTPVAGINDAAPTSAPTTLIPNDDMVAHAATVRELSPVCQVG